MNPWIKTEDGLPPNDTRVLLGWRLDDSTVTTAGSCWTLKGVAHWHGCGHYRCRKPPTHWMLIPEIEEKE